MRAALAGVATGAVLYAVQQLVEVTAAQTTVFPPRNPPFYSLLPRPRVFFLAKRFQSACFVQSVTEVQGN